MPIREEVPKSPGRQVVSAQSLKDLATLAFEAGALAVGQSGAAIKDSRSVPLQSYPMLGRASNLVRATTEGDFGPIEVFGEQTPFPGSKQVHGELPFSGIDGNFLSTEDVNLVDADTAHGAQSIGLWAGNSNNTNHRVLADSSSPFGGTSIAWDNVNDAASSSLYAPNPAVLTAGVASIWIKSPIETDAWLQVNTTDGQFRSTLTDIPVGWSHHSVQFTSADGVITNVVPAIGVTDRDDFVPGLTFQYAAFCIREGTDPTFVPSQRIVGVGDFTIYTALVDWTPAHSNYLFYWDGDNYIYVDSSTPGRLIAKVGGAFHVAPTNLSTVATDGEFGVVRALVKPAGSSEFFFDGSSLGSAGSAATPDYAHDLALGGLSGVTALEGNVQWAVVRDGENGPPVAVFDAFDLYGLNLYDGQTCVDGVTGRTWTVHGDNWPASIDVIEDDLNDEFGGFDDYDAAIELNGVDQFIQTEDINLLDADTAHFVQSIGAWKVNGSVVQSDDFPHPDRPDFPYVMKWEINDGLIQTINSVDSDIATMVGAVEGDVLFLRSKLRATIDGQMRVTCQFRNASNGLITTVGGTYRTVSTTDWTSIVESFTAPADTAYARFFIYFRVNADDMPPPGEFAYGASMMITKGSIPDEFVPSLRIVSDLDIRALVAPAAIPTTDVRYIVGNDMSNDYQGFCLYLPSSGGSVVFRYSDGLASRAQTSGAFSLASGEATEIRATFDVSTGGVVYYENGAQVDTDSAASGPGVGTDQPLEIGRYPGTDIRLWDGDMYWVEVRDGIAGPLVQRFEAKNMKEVGDLPPGFSHMGEDGRLYTFPNGATMKWTPKLVAGP